MLPSGVTIARVRRGATAWAAAKQSRLHAVRDSKAIDALRWLKTHNQYYSDVTIDRSRLDSIPEGGGEIPGVQDWGPIGPLYPMTTGSPCPDKSRARSLGCGVRDRRYASA